jgi:hypothetical protein
MAPEPGHKPQRLAQLASEILLCSTTALFAGISLFSGKADSAAETTVWQQLLRVHDRIALAVGSDQLGSVYVTDERLIAKIEIPPQETLRAAADAVNRYAESQTAPVFLLAAPTSAGIYSETLPDSAPNANERMSLRHFSEMLDEPIVWLEAGNWLDAEREQYIYYRTDPCWTGYGAFCVYRAAIRRLGFNAVGYDKFAVVHCPADYYGRLAAQAHYYDTMPDLVDIYRNLSTPQNYRITALRESGNEELSSFFREDLAAERPEAVFASANEPVLRIETENQNSKDLLLLADEFGGSMIPFLMQHYRTITAVNMNLTDHSALQKEAAGEYSQILILCGANTVTAPEHLISLLTAPEVQ